MFFLDKVVNIDKLAPEGIVPDKPYAHWHLNESSGANVADGSENGRNGICINMEDEDWVAGKLNNCLQFDGVNEYVNCGDIANFERTDAFSLECWFKLTAKGTLLGRRDNSGAPWRGWQLVFDASGRPTLILCSTYGSNAITVRVNVDCVDNSWHHIVITYDGSSSASGVKFYIDGNSKTVVIVEDSLSATMQIISKNCQIAAVDGVGVLITGLIDEVVIYDKELTQSDVTYRYNDGDGREDIGMEAGESNPTHGSCDKEGYASWKTGVKMNIQPASPEIVAIAEGVFGRTYTAFTTISGIDKGDRITVSGTGRVFTVKGMEDWNMPPLPHIRLTLIEPEVAEIAT